jgi:hypothetical protein
MSHEQPTLQAHLRAQFQLAFGAPHRTMGHDDHWQLRCANTSAINVLVNGSPKQPAVWVFSTHERANGVFSRSIDTQEQVAEVIVHIQERLKLPSCGE